MVKYSAEFMKHNITLKGLIVFVGFLLLSQGLFAAKNPYKETLKKLKHKDPIVRRMAINKVAQSRDLSYKDPLIKLLADKSDQVRSAACDALGIMRVKSASPKISQILLNDPKSSVRQAAAISLGYISDSGHQ